MGFAPNPTLSGKADPYYDYKSTVLSVSALDDHPDRLLKRSASLNISTKIAYWGLAELISCAPVRTDLADDPRLKENVALSVVADVVAFQKDPVAPPEDMYGPWSDALGLMTREGYQLKAPWLVSMSRCRS